MQNDLISREAIINAIYKMELSNWVKDEIEKTIRELPPIESSHKGHWIPVSERLPERNKRVIVCYETMEGLKVDTSMFDKYGCLLGKAVAWMPLPEPYNDMRGNTDAE